MAAETEPKQSTDTFLKELGDKLKANEGADIALADVLVAHILQTQPAKNAVSLAKERILQLAAERAAPPMQEVADG